MQAASEIQQSFRKQWREAAFKLKPMSVFGLAVCLKRARVGLSTSMVHQTARCGERDRQRGAESETEGASGGVELWQHKARRAGGEKENERRINERVRAGQGHTCRSGSRTGSRSGVTGTSGGR